MNTLIFKIRFCRKARHVLAITWRHAWIEASAWVECYGIDDCDPIEAVEETVEAWRQSL